MSDEVKLSQYEVSPNKLTSARKWLFATSPEHAIELAGYTPETATATPTGEVTFRERTWDNGG